MGSAYKKVFRDRIVFNLSFLIICNGLSELCNIRLTGRFHWLEWVKQGLGSAVCDEFSLVNFIFYNEGSVIVCLFLFHHAKVWLIATKPRRAILRICLLFLLLCGARVRHDNA